jgi:hypothetical protein
MNIGQINNHLENLILNFDKESFIYDLLLAYGTPKATIARAQLAGISLFEDFSDDVVIRKKVFFRVVDSVSLASMFKELRTNDKVRRQEPRFIIVTDFDTLFEVMNTDYKNRNPELSTYLSTFPFVNGGLFGTRHEAPVFTQRSRRMLIEAGSLKWSDINPDFI